MTRQQLIDRVEIRHASGYGQYTIYITYRGKEYKCHSTNSEAYDWYDDDSDPRRQLEALRMAWNECKRANELN